MNLRSHTCFCLSQGNIIKVPHTAIKTISHTLAQSHTHTMAQSHTHTHTPSLHVYIYTVTGLECEKEGKPWVLQLMQSLSMCVSDEEWDAFAGDAEFEYRCIWWRVGRFHRGAEFEYGCVWWRVGRFCSWCSLNMPVSDEEQERL